MAQHTHHHTHGGAPEHPHGHDHSGGMPAEGWHNDHAHSDMGPRDYAGHLVSQAMDRAMGEAQAAIAEALQGRPESDRSGSDRSGPDRSGPDRSGPDRSEPDPRAPRVEPACWVVFPPEVVAAAGRIRRARLIHTFGRAADHELIERVLLGSVLTGTE